MLVARALQSFASRHKKLKVLFGSTAPENLTGEIKRLKPTHLIIVDSADTGKKAGDITVLEPEEAKGISFSTHQLPLVIMARYLKQELACQVLIIGIKPKNLKFGFSLSGEVESSVKALTAAIKETLLSGN
jgi:hydrogenase 3 maturation protease